MKELFLEDDEIRVILSFLPCTDKDVPKGVHPSFYHTLNYEDEVKLFDVIKGIQEKLEN